MLEIYCILIIIQMVSQIIAYFNMLNYLLRLFIAVLISPAIVFAAECPSGKNDGDEFVLAHGQVRSEFRRSGPIVLVENDFQGAGKQRLFLFRGLIELARSGDDGNYSQHFTSNLEAFWPLKVGARRTFEFLPLETTKIEDKWSLTLAVTKRRAFPIKFCNYEVFYVTYDIRKNGKEEERWTAVYSPDLRATVAKIYDEGTEDKEIVAYNLIAPLKR